MAEIRWMLTLPNATFLPWQGRKVEIAAHRTFTPSQRQICCGASIQHESLQTHECTHTLREKQHTPLSCVYTARCLRRVSQASSALSSQLARHSPPWCRMNTQLESLRFTHIVYFCPLTAPLTLCSRSSLSAHVFPSVFCPNMMWGPPSLDNHLCHQRVSLSLCECVRGKLSDHLELSWQCMWSYQGW